MGEERAEWTEASERWSQRLGAYLAKEETMGEGQGGGGDRADMRAGSCLLTSPLHFDGRDTEVLGKGKALQLGLGQLSLLYPTPAHSYPQSLD